jgi:hypothetical protein
MTLVEQQPDRVDESVERVLHDAEALLREAHRRRKRRRLIMTASVVVGASCVGAALLAATPGRHPAHPVVPTTPSTVAVVVSRAPQACTAASLYAAAATAEHFTSHSPGYGGRYSPPGMYGYRCIGAWAIGSVGRPYVGPTDGTTIFRVRDGRWTEFGTTGFPVTECNIAYRLHVPVRIARIMAPPSAALCADGLVGSWSSSTGNLVVAPSGTRGAVSWVVPGGSVARAQFSVRPLAGLLAIATVTASTAPRSLPVGTSFRLVNQLAIDGPVPFATSWCSSSAWSEGRCIYTMPVGSVARATG